MASMPWQDVQKLLEEIEVLRDLIRKNRKAGDRAPGDSEILYYTVLAGLYGGDGSTGKWETMSEEQRARAFEGLTKAKKGLIQEIVAAGLELPGKPATETGIMSKRLAPDWMVVALTVVAVAATGVLLWYIYLLWPVATARSALPSAVPGGPPTVKGPAEADVLLMIILMGTLGGLLHVVSSFGVYVGNRQFYRSWIVYYLLMPFEGAALAPVIYLILRVGVLAPGADSASSTGSLNEITLYGFAGIAGLFAKQAMDMLRDVFSVLFKKITAKDALEEDAGGDAGAKPGLASG